jgi:hypothetical protein
MKSSKAPIAVMMIALAWFAGGCEGVVQSNLLNGLYTTVAGTAGDLVDGFFADQFGFEAGEEEGDEHGHEEEDEHGEEGNDLHIRI